METEKQTNFDFISHEEKNSENTVEDVYTDKDLMVRKQYELFLDSNQIDHTDDRLETFRGSWSLCESYMMQVLKYALANKDELEQKED